MLCVSFCFHFVTPIFSASWLGFFLSDTKIRRHHGEFVSVCCIKFAAVESETQNRGQYALVEAVRMKIMSVPNLQEESKICNVVVPSSPVERRAREALTD